MAQNTKSIILDKIIDAPIEKVFSMLTEGDKLVRWFPRTAETDPVVGGHLLFTFEFLDPASGSKYDSVMNGEFLELKPNEKVRYTWQPGPMNGITPPVSEVAFSLSEKDGQTVVHLEQTGLSDSPESKAGFDMAVKGWTFFLANLKSVIEQGKDSRIHS